MQTLPYDREKAVAYAKRWWKFRNPAYYNFDKIGGDCTNFASQCLFSGARVMNYSWNNGWFYIDLNNRSYSWTSVKLFYDFLIGNKGAGPIGSECKIEDIELGDFIQLGNFARSFYHTLIVVKIDGEPSLNTVYVSAHDYDFYERPLSLYKFDYHRCIHIDKILKY